MPTIMKNGKNYSTGVAIDSSLSTTSENTVQNKVITTALNNKANSGDLSTLTQDYNDFKFLTHEALYGNSDSDGFYQKISEINGLLEDSAPYNRVPLKLTSESTATLDEENRLLFEPSQAAIFETLVELGAYIAVEFACDFSDVDWEHTSIKCRVVNDESSQEWEDLLYNSEAEAWYCRYFANGIIGRVQIKIETTSELDTEGYDNCFYGIIPFVADLSSIGLHNVPVKLKGIEGTFPKYDFYYSNKELTNKVNNLVEDISETTTVTTSTDSTPYLYRQSKAIGDREYLEYIDGGSLGWNQLVSDSILRATFTASDVTFTKVTNGYALSGSASSTSTTPYITTSIPYIHDHIYFIFDGAGKVALWDGYHSIFNLSGSIIKWDREDGISYTYVRIVEGTSYSGNIYPQIIDLTLALDSTVADYVYSLEQATAGSGISWLKEQGLFTDDYYAYDAGSIKSVNVSGHKMVGFNQWDEEWELGYWDNASGTPYAINTEIRSKNAIQVEPNTTYFYKKPVTAGSVVFFDGNQNYIGYYYRGGNTNYIFTTPANCHYIKINMGGNYGTTYNYDICINISNAEKNGTYEPYEEHTYPITSTDLRGIPKLTSDNKLSFDGDRYNANGRIDRKYGIVDLGSVEWSVYDNGVMFSTSAPSNIKFSTSSAVITNWIICPKYTSNSPVGVITSKDNKTITVQQNTGRLYICDSAYSDAATFKTAMSGTYLVYEKATPTTENVTPIINPQICSPYGTEEFISDSPVPVPHSMEYYKTPDWMDVEPFKSERENNDSNTQLLSVINSRIRQDITDRLSNLSQAVAEQNLGKYGYKIGDYFVGASGYNYILADYNTFKGTSTPYCLTTNHIGIVVDTKATSQWYSGDASSVGYNGSTLHTYLKGTVMDNIKADMIALFGGSTGLEHLLAHSKLLTTALANWAWQSNQYISALSEVQTIGSVVWGGNGYQTGEASKKLELFDKYKWTEIFSGEYPWLRDLQSDSIAGRLSNAGYAHNNGVAYSGFVVGLINFY